MNITFTGSQNSEIRHKLIELNILKKGSQYIISGNPKTGKTDLVLDILLEGMKHKLKIAYIGIDESATITARKLKEKDKNTFMYSYKNNDHDFFWVSSSAYVYDQLLFENELLMRRVDLVIIDSINSYLNLNRNLRYNHGGHYFTKYNLWAQMIASECSCVFVSTLNTRIQDDNTLRLSLVSKPLFLTLSGIEN